MTTYPGEGKYCYPRLDPPAAAERYAALLAQLPAGHQRVTTSVVKKIGAGVTRPEIGITAADERHELVAVPAATLTSLSRKVRKLAESHGFPDVAHRGSTNFDTSCGDLLVSEMSILPWDATSIMVWANLALVVLPDVAAWRYPDLHEDHFATRIDRHVLGRLWWRSYILDGANSLNGHAGTPLGEDELVAIFERPVSIGRMPAVAREMVGQIRSVPRTSGAAARSEIMREFAKRMAMRSSHLVLDSLGKDELGELCERELARATHDVRAGVRKPAHSARR